MIGGNDKITKGQQSGILFVAILGVGILSLPSSLAKEFGGDGIFMILLGLIISSILVTIITKLMTRHQGKTIVKIVEELLPKPLAKIVLVLFLIYFLFIPAYIIRIFSAVIKMFLLNNTPLEIIILTMFLVTAYLLRKGIESIGRIVELIIPIVIIPYFIILITLIPEVDFGNLLPLFQISFRDVIKGIPLIMFSFFGFETLLVTTAYVDRPNKLLRYNLLSIVSISIIYLIIFSMCMAQFGKVEMQHLLWPTLSLMKTVYVPGAFIENVDGIVIALWTFLILGNISTSFYTGTIILSKSLNLKEYKMLVLPLVPIIYLISLIADNIGYVYEYIDIFIKTVGVVVVVFIPIMLFVISLLKGKGNNKNVKNN